MTAQAAEEVERSADPDAARLALDAVGAAHEGAADRIAADPALASALVAVAGASAWLVRVCVTDPAALQVLADLETPIDLAACAEAAGGARGLARAKRLELLRIAARDLLGLDRLEEVGTNLADLAAGILQQAWAATKDTSGGLAVIGMGKLGGCELNYSSDVDILFAGPPDDATGAGAPDPRPLLHLARSAWRVDLDLRPEGRAGPLSRSLASYAAYWDRWADTWEFQALLKGRAVAGDPELGARFEEEAARRVWGRPFGAEELREVRDMKARAEHAVRQQGLGEREIKRGKGGIRDIEFAVQLLQLVHGRADPALRSRSTLPALGALAAGGYVDAGDAEALEDAYRFLRAVEHRLQLREDQQVHTVPAARASRERLARVLGYRDRPSATALAQFDWELRRQQATVRQIHERVFFRPLMEAFTAPAAGAAAAILSAGAADERLRAFGFDEAERAHQAVAELTRGLSRSSRLMQQMLPVLLEWLSRSPDPDLGLLGLRTLTTGRHRRDQFTSLCRESPEAARHLCQLLGTGPRFARELQRHPDLLTGLATGETLAPRTRAELDERLARSLAWRSGQGGVEAGLLPFARSEALRIAARDLLDLATPASTGEALSDLGEAVVAAALRVANPAVPFAVIGMGRLGGRELAYSSDLDVQFVYDIPAGWAAAEAAADAEAAALALVRILGGATPATGVYRVDTGLRPEGRQGPQARSLDAYAAYYDRWAQPWERQALLRSRFVAGDEELGRRFDEVAADFMWSRPFGQADIREIRRLKARVERERVPAGEDPQFHLKLGPGSLSDVEWTTQLLQLRHGVRATSTVEALEALLAVGALDRDDGRILLASFRFCERTRNRLRLVRDGVSDALPAAGRQLTVLARSLGTTASGLREEYRRHTRRARRVVERVFYGGPAGR